MPQIFKGLVTVSVWALFVGAWLSAATNFIVGGIITGYAYSAAEPPMSWYVGFAICIGFAFAGGFLMLVRKKLE